MRAARCFAATIWVVAVEVRIVEGDALVRAAGWYRRCGIAFATLWGFVAASNVVVTMTQGAWAPAAVVAVFGLAGLHWVLAWSAASVHAGRDGLRIRAGLLRRRVATGDITAIRIVGPTFQSRIVLVVTTATGHPRRIRTVQQICTAKNRQALESAAAQLAHALVQYA
jgi:hypothetical protein